MSKNGKVYHTNVNGVESPNHEKRGTFSVMCQENSNIHKLTSGILVWKSSYSYRTLRAETVYSDWVREYI